MDVDNPAGKPGAEVIGEHLHVASEDDDIGVALLHESECSRLGLGLRFRRDGNVLESDAVCCGEWSQVRVVRHNHRNFDGQFALGSPVEQVNEAVIELANHQHSSTVVALVAKTPLGREVGAMPRQRVGDLRSGWVEHLESGPHAEQLKVGVSELSLLQDVGADLEQRRGHGIDDPALIAASEGEDVGRHGGFRVRWPESAAGRSRGREGAPPHPREG